MKVLNLFDLTGKVALVTGGKGLYGRQIVRALAEAGATTYVASRGVEELRSFADMLVAKGLDVRPLFLDQGDEAAINRARDAIVADVGHLDVLVNNAVARAAPGGMNSDPADWDESFHINGTGLLMVTRAMGEILREGGAIINIGSIMGLVGLEPLNYQGTDMQGWYPDYYFHKGGMANLTRFLASYYGARNIRCNCVHPGGLQTEDHPDAFVQNYSERTCLGRLAGTEDLMGTIIYLASDASAYVTGVNLPVDGGYTAK